MMSPIKMAVLAGTLACGLTGACSGGGAGNENTQTITLGAVVDSTGSAGDGNWANAVSLAADELDAALAAAKSAIRFQFLVNDSTNVPTVAVARAIDLVRMRGAKALVTDTSQDTLETVKLQYDADPAKHLDVPIVGMAPTSPSFGNPMATNPDALTQTAFRDTENWAFRTVMSTTLHGRVLTEIIRAQGTEGDTNGDGKVKVGIIASNEPFGLGYVGVLKAGLAAALPSAVTETILFPTSADPNDIAFFAGEYAKLVDARNEETGLDDGLPDMLLVFTFPSQSAAIIKAHVQGGATVPMLGGMGLRANKVLASLGSDANGQGGVSPILIEQNASGNAFAEALHAMTGLPPAQADAKSYDAAVTLMLASLIAARGQADPTAITGAQIRDALRATSDPTGEIVRTGTAELTKAVRLIEEGHAINYEGASGPCDYDENGNVTTRIARFTVIGGAFVDSAVFDCVQDPSCPGQ
jgi:ABC-type branched-subunit amino acid transport system substrate-binding protein